MLKVIQPKVRASRAPAPALPAFESLDETHRRVLEVLVQLDGLLQKLDDDGGADSAAQAAAREIFEFFAGTARQHHEAEERLVFPDLLASDDPVLVQHVLRLQQDHGWLEEDWLALAPQIEAIARGYNWYDVDNLRHALPVFSALYHEHIGLEESLIYPEARRRQQTLQERAARGS